MREQIPNVGLPVAQIAIVLKGPFRETRRMLSMTSGEWIVTSVLFWGIVSASWWPVAGEWVAARLSGDKSDPTK